MKWAFVLLGLFGLGDAARVKSTLRSSSLRTMTMGAGNGEVWTSCALEGEFLAGEGLVRFGWSMAWVEATLPQGAQCVPAAFGSDPAPGIRKVCECAKTGGQSGGSRRNELGVQWSRCADEGSNCKCPSGTVRFGLGSRWLVHEGKPAVEEADHVPCDPQSFSGADPSPGLTKECWCEEKIDRPKDQKVAIVMDSRRPPDLKTWLQYHIAYMGVDHVFVQVEDTPDFPNTWASLSPEIQKHVTAWTVPVPVTASGDKRPTDDYETLQARQLQLMLKAKDQANSMGITWLLHIDDDELLYTPLHRHVGEVLGAMPSNFDQAFIPNVEAVFKSPTVKSCFTEATEVNVNPYAFVSYANGKSAVRASNKIAVPAGPHHWHTSLGGELASVHLDKEPFGPPLMLIHFESCPFGRWEEKFWELSNTSPQKVSTIPFQFYRESISRMQQCGHVSKPGAANGAAAGTQKCSQVGMARLWADWKTEANPRISHQDIMPIQIPWDKVFSMQPEF